MSSASPAHKLLPADQLLPPDQENAYRKFLVKCGRETAPLLSLGADMGARRYFMVEDEKEDGALLMDMSRSGPESGLDVFVKIATYLKTQNVRVPEIFETDMISKFALIEYMGDYSFGDIMRAGRDEAEVYAKATDILLSLAEIKGNPLELVPYNATRIRRNVRQFVDEYLPHISGRDSGEETVEEFEEVWRQIEDSLRDCPLGICHADFHLENIIWREGATDSVPYGLIDFQDAFRGPIAYDLVNLLEDARKTVPHSIKQDCRARYIENLSASERTGFDDWYLYMSAQFHCRVLGLFIKFSRETGTDRFMAHIPRLQNYMAENLKDDRLAPLHSFMERHSISF